MSLLCAACAHPDGAQRRAAAIDAAARAAWHEEKIVTDDAALAAYVPATLTHADSLRIYIEGDGLAWASRSSPSSDPTPSNPLALKLALSDPSGRAVYLARPCQYVVSSNCTAALWTNRRFSPEVIRASDQAVDQLKRRYGAKELVLIGYSGGATVAALVAARRGDVARLVTVAGNLDTAAWTKWHRISPLSGSLNPADEWPRLAEIQQTHFVGGKDATVPMELTDAYRQKFPAAQRPELIVVEGATHSQGWIEDWPDLLGKLPRSPTP